jgi:hypothetical protein
VFCPKSRRHIADSTVRWHIKHIFAKTETHRQADLGRVLTSARCRYCFPQEMTVAAPLLECRRYQVTLDGRNTAMSVFPSPS